MKGPFGPMPPTWKINFPWKHRFFVKACRNNYSAPASAELDGTDFLHNFFCPEILQKWIPKFLGGSPQNPWTSRNLPRVPPDRPKSTPTPPDLRLCDPNTPLTFGFATPLSFDFATQRPPELRFCHPKSLLSFGYVTLIDLS